MVDLHNDILTSGLPIQNAAKLAAAATEHTVVYAYWTSRLQHDALKKVAPAIKRFAKIARANYFAVEDCHFFTPGGAVELCALPLVYCSLTWNDDNALAGGAMGQKGLSELGETAVRTFNSAGIAVDTAHLNRKSFFQVIEKAESVVCSHCNLNEVCFHPRNLTDTQVRALINRGGLIGLSPVRDFLNGRTDTAAFADSLDRYVQRYGINNLAIGTDFYGTTPLEGLKNYAEFGMIEERLKKLGYSCGALTAIFTDNAKNWLQNTMEKRNGKRFI